MKRIFIFILIAVAVSSSFATHYSNKYVCFDVADSVIILPDSIVFITAGARNTIIRKHSITTDSIMAHLYGTADSLGGNPWTSYLRSDVTDTAVVHGKLYMGAVNNYQSYLGYFDSTGNYHVGDPFVLGAFGANRKKTIIDPGNEYDIEINVSGVSGGNYPYNIYCSEGDTTYYWSIYNHYGSAPVIYSSYPLHLYGPKNLTPALEREWKQFAVYDSLNKLRVAIFDTVGYSPIKTYDLAGNLKAWFGQRCSTQYSQAETLIANSQVKVYGSDTLTISHSGDNTHYATTASNHHFDKNVYIDGNVTGSSYYGGLWHHDDAGVTISFAASGTWYAFSGFRQGMLNGFTADSANGTLTAIYGSKYRVQFWAAGTGQNNHVYHIAVARNDTILVNTEDHMTGQSGVITKMSGGGHITLVAGSVLKLKIQDASGTGDGTLYNCNFILERIGN